MTDSLQDAAEAAEKRWRNLASLPDDEIDLPAAALEIAAPEYRDLDVPGYLRRIDTMASTLRRRLRRDISTADTLIALNHYLFDELGFAGNRAEYYDPRNSYLNEVLDRRLGIPITLSILYVEIGQRVGLALRGVSFPGHFLVRCSVRDGAIVLDPYSGGASLGMDDLRRRLESVAGGAVPARDDDLRRMITAAGKKEILARVLRNLRAIHRQNREPDRALRAAARIIALDPAAADEYRDRAEIYLELECFRAALEDFESYLKLLPGARDAGAVRAKIAELRAIASRLN